MSLARSRWHRAAKRTKNAGIPMAVIPWRKTSDIDRWEPQLCIQMLRIPGVHKFSSIKKLLQRAPKEWLLEFLKEGGLGVLIECLERLSNRTLTVTVAMGQLQCVGCLRAVMNSQVGLQFISQDLSCSGLLTSVLVSGTPTVKLQVFELLCALCMFSKEGHDFSMLTLNNFTTEHGFKRRFDFVLLQLKSANTFEYQTVLLAFINCTIYSEPDVRQRNSIRNEFLMTGLEEILEEMKQVDDDSLHIQLIAFEDHKRSDEVDYPSPSCQQLLDRVVRKVTSSPHYYSFYSFLQRLAEMNSEEIQKSKMWDILNKIVAAGSTNFPAENDGKLMKNTAVQTDCRGKISRAHTISERKSKIPLIRKQQSCPMPALIDSRTIVENNAFNVNSVCTCKCICAICKGESERNSKPITSNSQCHSSSVPPTHLSTSNLSGSVSKSSAMPSFSSLLDSPSLHSSSSIPPPSPPPLSTSATLPPVSLNVSSNNSLPTPIPSPPPVSLDLSLSDSTFSLSSTPLTPISTSAPAFPLSTSTPISLSLSRLTSPSPPPPPPLPKLMATSPISFNKKLPLSQTLPPSLPLLENQVSSAPPPPPPLPSMNTNTVLSVPPPPPPLPPTSTKNGLSIPPPPPPPPLPSASPINELSTPPPPLLPPPPPPLPTMSTKSAPAPPMTPSSTLMKMNSGLSTSFGGFPADRDAKFNSFPLPKSKMKTINWTKLPNQVIGKSLWSMLDTPPVSINYNQLEELFCQQQKTKLSGKLSSAIGSPKIQHINLLDSRRSLAVNIFLKQFKEGPAEILNAIINSKDFDPEQLRGLKKILPDTNEIKQLKNYTGDKEHLGTAEKFYLQLMEIPNYDIIIDTLLQKAEYPVSSNDLKTKLKLLCDTCYHIIDNQNFKQFLAVVLELGNFLNVGSYAGNALGFKLSTLPKLMDIRANKPRMTFLHFVISLIQNNNAEILSFAENATLLHSLSRTPFAVLEEEVRSIVLKIKHLNIKITKDEKILETYSECLNKMVESTKELEKYLEEAKSARTELATYFGEDVAAFSLEECFSLLANFFDKVKQAMTENEQHTKLQEKAKKLEIEQQLNKKLKKKPIPKMDSEICLVDMLMQDIRNGSFSLRRTRNSVKAN